VETSEFADVYLASLDNYDDKYRGRAGKAIDDWGWERTTKKNIRETRMSNI